MKGMWKEARQEAIAAVGKSGGLWTIWDLVKFGVERIHCSSNRCLTMRMTCKSSKFSFVISNVYAPNVLANRRQFYTFIYNYHASFQQSPWLVGGDFNSPLNLEDKLGGKISLSTSMQDFKDFVNKNELIDLSLKGSRYTWSNRRIGKGFIMRRLDRILVSQEWINHYQNSSLLSLPHISSDHRPIALSLEPFKNIRSPFKF